VVSQLNAPMQHNKPCYSEVNHSEAIMSTIQCALSKQSLSYIILQTILLAIVHVIMFRRFKSGLGT
jgi:hypothetical protein